MLSELLFNKFIKKNNIEWQQTFIKLNSNNEFLKKLNIKGYPTIILIDKNNKIHRLFKKIYFKSASICTNLREIKKSAQYTSSR